MSLVDIETGVYTLPETAKRWGISERTLYRLVARDDAPVRPIKIGTAWRFPRHLVDAVARGELPQ